MTTRYTFMIENESGVQDILVSDNPDPAPPGGWHFTGAGNLAFATEMASRMVANCDESDTSPEEYTKLVRESLAAIRAGGPIFVVSGGQSLTVGGRTFATSWVNSEISSWRVDGEEVTEAEFNEALKEARPPHPSAAGQALPIT